MPSLIEPTKQIDNSFTKATEQTAVDVHHLTQIRTLPPVLDGLDTYRIENVDNSQ